MLTQGVFPLSFSGGNVGVSESSRQNLLVSAKVIELLLSNILTVQFVYNVAKDEVPQVLKEKVFLYVLGAK